MSESIGVGKRVLVEEASAIQGCADHLGGAFASAVDLILACKGRVITCGLGKSGHIARKTSGTLSSTGTPSLFLHATEAMHGDLGMVAEGDVVLFYSHSGETDELIRLMPAVKAQGAKMILVTGRPNSTAGRIADLILDTGVQEEACPHNLAPTTSTTVMLSLSDALALAVMEKRGFKSADFARLHPSGSLGRRLYLRVSDVMRPAADIAILSPAETVMSVIEAMTSAGVGVACLVEDGSLVGIVSESDWRRAVSADRSALDHRADQISNPHPATIEPGLMAVEALEVFQNFPAKIGELPVLDQGRLVGLLVLKDLLRSGIV